MERNDTRQNTNMTVVTRKAKAESGLAIKADMLASNAGPDDSLECGLFDNAVVGAAGAAAVAIHPQFPISTLRRLVRDSSTLPPCLDSLRTNIASTGYDVLSRDAQQSDDGTPADDAGAKDLMGFFTEVWPGVDLVELVKDTVEEMESVGTYYWEVLRNGTGEIMFLRGLKMDYLRPLKYSESDKTTKKLSLIRGGKEIDIENFETYERRFVKISGVISTGGAASNSTVFFREFGSTRKLNKKTGVWADDVPLVDQATELIVFSATGNGAPRWVSDLSSVLGEQEAGDLNLAFFEAGGVPPAIIALIGGQLTKDSSQRLSDVLTGKAKEKLSVAVVEIFSTGGSLDGKDAPAKMDVHKFGAESQQDSLFTKYLADCSSRIRRRWRLPAILVGDSAELSYATAFVSYMIGEEQVFAPMRKDVYAVINSTVMKDPSMSGGKYILKPKPLTIKDSKQIQVALDNALAQGVITKQEWVRQTNALLSLDIVMKPGADDAPPKPEGSTDPVTPSDEDPAGADNSRTDVGTLNQQGTNSEAPRNSEKAEKDMVFLLNLVDEVAACLLTSAPVTDDMAAKMDTIANIPGGSAAFKQALTAKVLLHKTEGSGSDALIGRSHDCC